MVKSPHRVRSVEAPEQQHQQQQCAESIGKAAVVVRTPSARERFSRSMLSGRRSPLSYAARQALQAAGGGSLRCTLDGSSSNSSSPGRSRSVSPQRAKAVNLSDGEAFVWAAAAAGSPRGGSYAK